MTRLEQRSAFVTAAAAVLLVAALLISRSDARPPARDQPQLSHFTQRGMLPIKRLINSRQSLGWATRGIGIIMRAKRGGTNGQSYLHWV